MSEPDIPSENMSPEAIAEAEAESPAFPWGQAVQGGLTKRELFAAMAMQGVCGSEVYMDMTPAALAKEAVLIADTLLKELAK